MGRTITPKYAVRLAGTTQSWNTLASATFAWNSKQAGRPTDANLEKFVHVYADSLKIGGGNDHVSIALGYMPFPQFAEIRENKVGGRVVATWKAGAFQVFGTA